ncbi:hypothetical protein SAMN05421786_11483 [Chryseobacterium ureilyticum]|uniref:Immunity protein 8 n=1 Tax=Chryseobacterium ureilyticum TaxID=373668 RepID=A0A1N7QQU7_9FLAO|nr:hypothetical protein [Chryseobacterium ureilyticum]SIT25241.1 hypothetical protein SAMN05421786_11483 [Chryseobacterium ureilyticum]
MKDFKVVFPSGYSVNDYYNDNIDLNIILPSGTVFFSTFFTIINVKNFIDEDDTGYFWSTDMLIVKDLKKETIKNVIFKMIKDGYLGSACTEIGKIQEIFCDIRDFSDIVSDI